MSALGDSVVGMMAHYGWSHAVILYDPDRFSLASASVYREKLQAAGVTIVYDQVVGTPTEELMNDIKETGCKIIITLQCVPPAATPERRLCALAYGRDR